MGPAPEPHARNHSLARRIWLAMALVALAPLLIMAMQGIHCAREAVVELEYTHLRSILAARKARLETWLKERENDLYSFSARSCGTEGCTGLFSHLTADHVGVLLAAMSSFEAAFYESLAVYDANGAPVGGAYGTSHGGGDLLLDADLRAKLADATGLVASASHTHADGHIGLHMGIPLRGKDGAVSGYLVVNIALADTLHLILDDDTDIGPAPRLYLLTDKGDYLLGPAGHPDLTGHRADVPSGILHPQEDRVFNYRGASGATVLGASARLPHFNWILVAEMPEKEAMGWVTIIQRRAAFTGLATFLVVLFMAFRFSRRLAEPMRVLSDTARRITGGARQERVAELRGAEAREVGHAFNEMLDTLALSQQRVVQSASLAAIGTLSASVVHEMRNPLSSIKLNLQALRKKVEGDSRYSELATIATEQALRLERMLTELLGFGKEIHLTRSPVPFRELAEETVSGLRPLAKEKDVQLRVHDALVDVPLPVDREQMRRALTNLVRNAIEAAPSGSEVVLEGVLPHDAEGGAELRIQDQGPGISAHVMDKLFQPFVTTREQGTGLGLANVKKIVEMHGGQVTARNLDGGGALFTLRIPLEKEPS